MFRVKVMSKDDLTFAVSLTNTMRWGLEEEDFEFMMELEPKGCFVLLDDSERIGVVTTLCFNHVSWLGSLIISEQHRKKGAGTMLASHAIKYLTDKNVGTIGLYSYMDKIPFYRRLGFKYNSRFVVLKGKGFSSLNSPRFKQTEKPDIQRIIDYDYSCLGFSRAKLLEPILLNSNNLCYMSVKNGELFGYGIAKVYNETAEIGPLVCHREHNQIAKDLLSTVINRLKDFEVTMCIPEKQNTLLDVLIRHGFSVDFRVARMFRGKSINNDCSYVAESLERG